MKNIVLFVILVLGALRISAASELIETTNTTSVSEQRLIQFTADIVGAINSQNRTAILALLHPACRQVAATNPDVRRFVDYLLSQKISAGYVWKANNLNPKSVSGNYLLSNNRWVVKPTMCLDIMWQHAVAGETEVAAFSICFAQPTDKLVVISYMNDYLAAELGPPGPAAAATPR